MGLLEWPGRTCVSALGCPVLQAQELGGTKPLPQSQCNVESVKKPAGQGPQSNPAPQLSLFFSGVPE